MTYADLPDILTPEIIRRYLKKSPNTIYDALRRKEIPGRMVGGTWLTGKHEFGVWLGIVGPDQPLAEEVRGLRAEIAELLGKG